MPINQEWTAGIGLSSPWGLVTEYDDGWIGRFQAMKSSIKTYNVNPAVSWKPAGNFAFGLGFNFQRIEAELTNQVNYGGALASGAQGLLTAGRINAAQFAQMVRDSYGLESSAKVEGSDNGTGWNIGLLWDLDANSRIGAQYRSRIRYTLSGDATFVNPAAPATVPGAIVAAVNDQLSNTSITSDIEMPEVVNLSYFRTIDGKWDVMVDAQWTGWSSIQALTVLRSGGSTLQSTPLNFKDVWKVAFGVNYRYNDQWMWRGGLAWDQSPVEDEYRTPRLPDSDRTWLSAGVQYKMSNALKFDFGGAYILGRDASININGHPPSTPTYGLLKGHYEGNAWVLSAQGTWSF
jgi:long-chain fatty acid transport protein